MTSDWTAGDLAVLDTETTGTDPETDRVVEVAVLRLRGLVEISLWTARVNPGIPIPGGASAVHGISDADVADSPPFSAIIPALSERLAGAQLLVYNAPFDVPLLCAEFARAGVSLLDAPFKLAVADTLDPLVWIRDVDRYVKGKGRHQLVATAKRWQVEATGQVHGALVDCRLASGLAKRLVEAGRVPRELEPLLRKQEIRRAAQESDFAAYRARVGAQG